MFEGSLMESWSVREEAGEVVSQLETLETERLLKGHEGSNNLY